MSNLSIIVAISSNRVIGCENRLLWHISEDLKRFKSLTSGHTVIMGRKTYESIGRSLPNRRNIVISRNVDLAYEACEVVSSLEEAMKATSAEDEVFVIGGGEIYRLAMDKASRIYLTIVNKEYEGDTFFPEIDTSKWEKVSEENYSRGEKYEYPYSFCNYILK